MCAEERLSAWNCGSDVLLVRSFVAACCPFLFLVCAKVGRRRVEVVRTLV